MKRPSKQDQESKKSAIDAELAQFELYYNWIQEHMPDSFFEEIEPDHYTLIAHYLMGFPLQDHFCKVELKEVAFVLALDSPEVDLRVLKEFHLYGIRNYKTFVSNTPPPFHGITSHLRIAIIHFTKFYEEVEEDHRPECIFSKEDLREVYHKVKQITPEITEHSLEKLLCSMDPLFLRSLSLERLTLALSMFFRSRSRDYCQYEIRKQEDWKDKEEGTPSLQIVLAWKNVPKYRFLFRLAKAIYRHHLRMLHVNATYINPYSSESILVMSIGLHGSRGKAVWEETDLDDFLRELVTLKYFSDEDQIEMVFVHPGLIRGNLGNFLRSATHFIHQTLVHVDPHMYTPKSIEEGLCRHPKLTLLLCRLFELKFHFTQANFKKYQEEKETMLSQVSQLDTGNEGVDQCHKDILIQGVYFIDFCLKTNFYRNNKSALSFRMNPNYLRWIQSKKGGFLPEIPYAIFFIQGMHFIGFHIRFKDLARGGLRTIFPQTYEKMVSERNHVFLECYDLAYTQQKKNKDIPEGGAKGIIFLEPHSSLLSEIQIYRKELIAAGKEEKEIEKVLQQFQQEQKQQYLYQTQRAFIHSLTTLVNFREDGCLRAKNVIDYWKKPEYIYLGPDENMSDGMIRWIAAYSKKCNYKIGTALISSKPDIGINHKRYGVTSFGVNVYMQEALHFLGIDPTKDPFTVKISGGPDGDVAGNQMVNLRRYFPNTAKLLAIRDVSGTIFDPDGLDLEVLGKLFQESKPIAYYPPHLLADRGYLLDLRGTKAETTYLKKTLCYRKEKGRLQEDWLSGSEMNDLFRHSLHQVKTDIFIPAGGRPCTLHEGNYRDFLDENGKPTARAIVEGANLYLTAAARRILEDLGVLIIKDSSANKGGVICSSMEILFSLVMEEEEFLANKERLVEQTLQVIEEKARDEAKLLLHTYTQKKGYLTDISDEISEKINRYTYEIFDYLETFPLLPHLENALMQAFLNFCPPLLTQSYREQTMKKIPLMHKKAIIACYFASRLVYKKGLDWSPSLVDILPLIATDSAINPTP